jgi:hypothetical protein
MAEEKKQPRKGRRKRSKDHHFMDVALDAFIRDQALHLWRDYGVYRRKPDANQTAALRDTGFFEDKAPYAVLWTEPWQRIVLGEEHAEAALFGKFEEAVRAAVVAEREARKQAGDEPLEDLPEYNEFLRYTLNRLLVDDPAVSKDG